jgi:two-component system response regulator YesN
MLKVAIVDDENIVRIGLQTFINWEENGYDLVGLFSNGKEVLEYCQSHPLDILLTDIKMPVMDGIELVKRLKKARPDLSILVLSNYDEFKLVSDAYKEGINDYLQKQFIEPKSLIEALDAIRQKKSKQGSEEREVAAEKSTKARKEELFKRLILFDIHSEGIVPEPQVLSDLITETSNLFLLRINPESAGSQEEESAKINRLATNICAVILETAGKYGGLDCFVFDNDSIILIASIPEMGGSKGVNDRLNDLGMVISKTILSIFNVDLCIGFSKKHDSLGQLHLAYIEATNALQETFYAPESRLFFSGDGKSYGVTAPKETELIRSILSTLRLKDFTKLTSILSGFFDASILEKSMNPAAFKQIILRILFEIEFYLIQEENLDNLEDIYVYELILQKVMDCNSVYVLRDLTMDIIQKLIRSGSHFNGVPMTNSAKKYILENYMNPIGLAKISEHLGVNNSHLCRLFKEKTGENLTYFISRIRIEKSIELIRNNNLSTDEIAEKVGFPNANYFIRVFKKITGITLSEFKGKQDVNIWKQM